MNELADRRIILGPGHYVLGDGYGNPGYHSHLYIDWQKFAESQDLWLSMVEALADKIRELWFELIVVPDDESLPSARMLAETLAKQGLRQPPPCGKVASFPVADRRAALIHDDFVNRGRQAKETIDRCREKGLRPVAITSLFTRLREHELFGVPTYVVFERPMAASPPEECVLCKQGMPVDPNYGKGALFVQRQSAAAGKRL
jgi:orotate phosphoribosyltransferase